MKVVNHRLCSDDGTPVRFEESPNQSVGIVPRFLVIHFTAGRGLEQSVRWLCSERAKASAHLVIGRNGSIVQLVDFNRRAWHAGKSSWTIDRPPGTTFLGLNAHSIGIELDNPGLLTRDGVGAWQTTFGERVAPANVMLAHHKNGGPERGWHRFSEEQIGRFPEGDLEIGGAAYLACEALIDAYPTIEDVLGHDDIAPTRKPDPGPAFPMESFRSWLFGRGEG